MKISDNAVNLLPALGYRGIGRKWVNDNLTGRPSVPEIVSRLSAKVPDAVEEEFLSRRASVLRRIEALGDAVDGVTGMGDDDFPAIAPGVKAADRPVALFYRGDLSLLDDRSRNVAVIGLLNPSEEIVEEERKVVTNLVSRGYRIVSGLALGCDSVSHRETLAQGGRTVAFLSSPLTEVNPPSNRPLAEEIVETGGLLVSEYYERPHSRTEFLGRYPERDRLQAMFVVQVVLAASYAPNALGNDCGSRFALDKAKAYGVSRAVIDPQGHVSDPMFDLNRSELAAGARAINVAMATGWEPLTEGSVLRQASLWD